MARLKAVIAIAVICLVAAFVSQTGFLEVNLPTDDARNWMRSLLAMFHPPRRVDRVNERVQQSICEGIRASGDDPGQLCSASNPQSQPFPISEYAGENGVDTKSFQTRYDAQKRYAIAIVDAHAKLSTASLCAAIVQDFGPQGKLAAGLVAERK